MNNLGSIDQELGYSGHDRFVLFYFEPRTQEVTWRDSQACGCGCNGLETPFATIEADARLRGISLGNSHESGDHVLLVDRVDQQVCYAYREAAQEFLLRRCGQAA